MNYSDMLRMLQISATPASPASARKWILRLPNRKEYARCYKDWKELKKTNPRLAKLRPIALINGFSYTGARAGKQWRKLGKRVRIERDYEISLQALSVTPQRSESPIVPWGVDRIQAPKLWNRHSGAGVRIGVIDTGIDYTHSDLRSSIGAGVNLMTPGRLPVDDNGHGTHIAGTIAALTARNGIIGVSPGATIHPVKAFDHNGTAYVSDIIAGIDWCVSHGIPIINMSFGMNENSPSLQQAVKNAYKQGTVIVASAGNDGKKGTIDYPAGYPETICVGATNRKDRVASFSNRRGDVDVYAPGADIYSCWRGGGYELLSGTSMATAHVSGALALLLSANRRQRLARIKRALIGTASPLKKKTGSTKAPGIINVWKAYRRLRKQANRSHPIRRAHAD